MKLRNMFRTVKTPYGPDPVYANQAYASIKSMEQGVPVPKTRNKFRISKEEGEEQAPLAITISRMWAMKYGTEVLSNVTKATLFEGTRKKVIYFKIGIGHYILWLDYVNMQAKRSCCYNSKEFLMDAYRRGRIQFIETCAMRVRTTATASVPPPS